MFIQVSPISESLGSDCETEIPKISNKPSVGIFKPMHKDASSYSNINEIQRPSTSEVM